MNNHIEPTFHEINFTVNGEEYSEITPSNLTLVEFLRQRLRLVGTTEGCGVGVCGCCTVLIDNKMVASCLELSVNIDGKSILTIEGLADTYPHGEFHPLQNSFREYEGFQCGYCTPGMLIASKALLDQNSDPSSEDIREFLSENICRCTGYDSIIEAIKDASKKMDR
jgi:carbon-monoxide dehydrogenase small subunit